VPAEVTHRRFPPPFKKVSGRHVKNFRQALERSKCGVAAAAFQMAEIGAVHATLLRNGSLGQPGRDAPMSHGLRQTRTPLFEVWRGFSAISQSAYPISWTVAMTTGALFASSNSLSIDIYCCNRCRVDRL
jgi:hypothetical protein